MRKLKASVQLAAVVSFVAVVLAFVFFSTPDAPFQLQEVSQATAAEAIQ